jgi:hypothetical protein
MFQLRSLVIDQDATRCLIYSWPWRMGLVQVWRYAPTPDYAPECYMRVLSAMRMMVHAMDWVETLPYWSRRGGVDHIFLMSHDEGACWAPQRAWPAIMLTHYGTSRWVLTRKRVRGGTKGPFFLMTVWGGGEGRHDAGYADASPEQSSGYAHDNWKFNCSDAVRYPAGTSADIGEHPCFDPRKDIVVPQFKHDPAYGLPQGCLSPDRPRTNLAFFAGRISAPPNPPPAAPLFPRPPMCARCMHHSPRTDSFTRTVPFAHRAERRSHVSRLPKTDVSILSWLHHTSSAPWCSTPSLYRSISMVKPS